MLKLFTHVGFPKTGSSFLQDCLFSKHPEIQYLGPIHKKYTSNDLHNVHSFILEIKDVETDKQGVLSCFKSLVKDFDDSLPVVLSNEGFTGEIRGGIHEGIPFEEEKTGTKLKAIRLSFLHNHIKIIFVIREQLSIIESMYFEYLIVCQRPEFCSKKPLLFEEWYAHSRNSLKANLNYYQIISTYSSIFGMENIKVFLYEDLKNDAIRYIGDICSYLGVDANIGIRIAADKKVRVRPTQRQFAFNKIRGKLFPHGSILDRAGRKCLPQFVHNQVKRFLKESGKPVICFPECIKEDIKLNCSKGNKAISEMLDRHLERYGYMVG